MLAIVEDDDVLGRSLQQRFTLEGYRVLWLRTAQEAERALDGRAARIVLSDIRLPDGDGESVMGKVFARHGVVPTIFMTAFGDIEQAVRLVRRGARDYIAKPFDLDELVARVREIAPPAELSRDNPEFDPFSCFGLSAATAELRRTLERVKDRDVSLLFQGETGTGKDLAARFLHESGARRSAPFVAVNCASVPETLFEDTFFGHEKGAFTGAATRQLGLAEQAGTGTLFLDEIGDIGAAAQAKLLRLIETREFRRLGGATPIQCKARFVFATNRDLEQEVAAGRFRQDLWFRINVVSCRVPPLQERPEEIEPLLRYHLATVAKRMGVAVPAVTEEVLAAARYDRWLGNVRELFNRVERAVALCDDGVIDMDDFWPDRNGSNPLVPEIGERSGATLANVREHAEREHIRRTLLTTEGRIQDTADRLGISRTTLWERMRRYGLE